MINQENRENALEKSTENNPLKKNSFLGVITNFFLNSRIIYYNSNIEQKNHYNNLNEIKYVGFRNQIF